MFRCILIIATVAMTGADATAQRPAAPLFERDVLPILNAHCLSCHGGPHQKGKLDLRALASLKLDGKNIAAIVTGDPRKSSIALSVVLISWPRF